MSGLKLNQSFRAEPEAIDNVVHLKHLVQILHGHKNITMNLYDWILVEICQNIVRKQKSNCPKNKTLFQVKDR